MVELVDTLVLETNNALDCKGSSPFISISITVFFPYPNNSINIVRVKLQRRESPRQK